MNFRNFRIVFGVQSQIYAVREYCTENDCLRWLYVFAMPKFVFFVFSLRNENTSEMATHWKRMTQCMPANIHGSQIEFQFIMFDLISSESSSLCRTDPFLRHSNRLIILCDSFSCFNRYEFCLVFWWYSPFLSSSALRLFALISNKKKCIDSNA